MREVNYVSLDERRIFSAQLVWRQGRISGIHETGAERPGLGYLIPGFIDAHVHIESAMLTPAEFGRIALRHGTLAVVADPHEIANVLGVAGVRFMLENARETPFHLFFGAPSCVPATPFETAHGVLGCAEIEALLHQPEVCCLSEMMNFPGVLARDPEVISKIALAQRLGYPVDGHAPGLVGEQAAAYVGAGISTDHECFSLREARDKIAAGMWVLIREGSAARNFDTLHPLISESPGRVMLCSDDKHPDDLLRDHISALAARALAKGHALFDVLRCACINPIDHYRLPLGRLRVGDPMDAVELADLVDLNASRVWLQGELVAEEGKVLLPGVPVEPVNLFHACPIEPSDLAVPSAGETIRVIGVTDGSLVTSERLLAPATGQGLVTADLDRDILQICVLNRYRPSKPALGFIQGFGLKRGAIASSVAHDSHNIVAVGVDPESICRAVNAVIENSGGIAVCDSGEPEILPLPLAGIMSDRSGDWVGGEYARLDRAARALGSGLSAPFMTLSFMALLVIPELKLSDRGLFDGRRFEFVDLWLPGSAHC
ncbi:MAG: adenine deaminase [Gammaproteobacteria bacterium]|nr:adenine deaminase [Gammaproteobacteria bacterium]